MTTTNGSFLIEQLGWRYAVKKFDATKKISDADWASLEKALVLSPSSYGIQTWRAIDVRDPELRKKLRGAAFNQSQVEDASHVVVFIAKKTMTEADVDRFIKLVSDTRGIPTSALGDYRTVMLGDFVNGPRAAWADQWAARQAYIALGVLLTTAAGLGIDACPMEGFVPNQFDEILGLSGSDFRSVVMATLGYRSTEDRYGKLAKVRYPDVVSHK